MTELSCALRCPGMEKVLSGRLTKIAFTGRITTKLRHEAGGAAVAVQIDHFYI